MAKGFIRESKSPIGILILFVLKKGGSLRLYINYRSLNSIIIKNRYPLLLITKIIDYIIRAKYFSKIDLKDVYYYLRIKAGDEWKTVFYTYYGYYEFIIIPIGLTNAPITFQTYINKAL